MPRIMTPSREQALTDFLDRAGWGAARRAPLGADWSTRRYERLFLDGRTAMLMDAPAPWTGQVAPFAAVCALLRDAGLSAPEVHALDGDRGFLISEDFGSTLAADLLDRGHDPWPVYELATDVLIHLHRRFDPAVAAGLEPWTAARFVDQCGLFGDHFAPLVRGTPLPDATAADLRAAWEAVVPRAFAVPMTLVLRDYFPGNIMWLPDRPGVRAAGLIDVQDAGLGPCGYDLLSLLEDARRDVPDDLRRAMVDRYLAAFPDLDRDAFATCLAVVAALRHGRILGRVAQLIAEDPAARQRAFLPRVQAQFTRSLSHPALAPLAAWVQTHLPNLDPSSLSGAVSR